MVTPEEVEGVKETPGAPPAPPVGAAGIGSVLPPAPPAEPISAGTVTNTETPVSGMSVKGLALILGPMLASQFKPEPSNTTNNI